MVSDAAPSRDGRKQLAGYFKPEVIRALKQLAMNRDTTIQCLMAEAINDLFEKNGLQRLADEAPRPRGGAAQRARRNG